MIKRSKLFTIISLVLITIVGFISYSNTFDAAFQFDDKHYIVDNGILRHINAYTYGCCQWSWFYMLDSWSEAIDRFCRAWPAQSARRRVVIGKSKEAQQNY